MTDNLPHSLDAVEPTHIYSIDGDPYMVALCVPDPELTGELVDESNAAVLGRDDETVTRYYRHWSWRRYLLVLQPPEKAQATREALRDYCLLDEHDYSQREAERDNDDDNEGDR